MILQRVRERGREREKRREGCSGMSRSTLIKRTAFRPPHRVYVCVCVGGGGVFLFMYACAILCTLPGRCSHCYRGQLPSPLSSLVRACIPTVAAPATSASPPGWLRGQHKNQKQSRKKTNSAAKEISCQWHLGSTSRAMRSQVSRLSRTSAPRGIASLAFTGVHATLSSSTVSCRSFSALRPHTCCLRPCPS
jgi:hypothetical protein